MKTYLEPAEITLIESMTDEERDANELEEMCAEYSSLEEFLGQDEVASYRGTMGNRTAGLISLLDRHGKFPETLTRKQAELILMGRTLKANTLTANGRVRWEYIIDELAEHFHMTDQELISRIEDIKAKKIRMDDLKGRMDDAAAADQARQASDILTKYISDVCLEDDEIPPVLDTKTSELYSAYKQWAENEGVSDRYILTSSPFELWMRDRYKVETREDGDYYLGIFG